MTDNTIRAAITGTPDALKALANLDRNAIGSWHLSLTDAALDCEMTGAEVAHDVLSALIEGSDIVVEVRPYDDHDDELVVMIGEHETITALLTGAATRRATEVTAIDGVLVPDPWGNAPAASGF